MRRLLVGLVTAGLLALAGCGGTAHHAPVKGGDDPLLLGYTTELGGTTTEFGGEHAYLARFEALHTGTVETIKYYTNNISNTTTAVRLGIFKLSTKQETEYPGPLIEEGEKNNGSAFGTEKWIEVTGLKAKVTAGTKYWLAVLPLNGILHFNRTEGISGAEAVYDGSTHTHLSEVTEEPGGKSGHSERIMPLAGEGTEEGGGGGGSRKLVMLP